jgi:hypothetical protein
MAETAILGGLIGSTVGQATGSLTSGFLGAGAANAQGRIQQRTAELNAQFAELRARDAIKRGEKEVKRFQQASKQLVGRQRVALAAQGIDVSTGSAREIQEEVATATTEDILEIRNNAWREAFGFRFEAENIRSEGALARLQGSSQATASLLTGGLGALDAFQTGAPGIAGALPPKVSVFT